MIIINHKIFVIILKVTNITNSYRVIIKILKLKIKKIILYISIIIIYIY